MTKYIEDIKCKNCTLDSLGYSTQIMDVTRALTKQERNRQEYFKRLLRKGVSPDIVKQRAIKALQDNARREQILANCADLNNSGDGSVLV